MREENAHKTAPSSFLDDVKGKGKGVLYDSDDEAGYASLSFPPPKTGNTSESRLNLSQLGTGSIMALWKEKDGELSMDEDEYESGDEAGVVRPTPSPINQRPDVKAVESLNPAPLPLTSDKKPKEAKPESKSLDDLEDEYPILPTIKEEDEKSDLSTRARAQTTVPGGFMDTHDDDELLYGENK